MRATMRSEQAPAWTVKSSRWASARPRFAPAASSALDGCDIQRLLGAQEQIQHQRVDPGYGDIVELARAPRASTSTSTPGNATPVHEAARRGTSGAAGQQDQIQRQRVDPGYGDIIELARAPQASTSTSMPGNATPVHEAARLGISGTAGQLPHLDAIQRSFGDHDVRPIRAHTDAAASLGARAMGAEAFAFGNDVAFARPPSLFTAAHEAAHVVQQRAGVQLSQGVGQAGDVHEQHADTVASLVLQGRSATALLDQYASGAGRAGHSVQCAPPTTKTPAPQTPVPSGPDLGVEADQATANSTYNKVVNAWTFLAQRQVLAIRSLYTEAQKPSKPSLLEELLTTLAEAALAGALGGIGGLLAGAIEKRVVDLFVSRALKAGAGRFRDEAGRIITTEAGKKLAAASSKNTAKFVSEFAKDAMKEGVKSLARPKIRGLLAAGKEPIDAFFEGQMDTAVDSGKQGSDAAEDKRAQVLANPNPVVTAELMYVAMNDIFDTAKRVQEDETLRKWLVYQAGADAGTVDAGLTGAGTTDLSGESWPGTFGSFRRGTLYVRVNEHRQIRKAVLKGSTANFVALLENKPINEMGIPVIIDFDFPGEKDFYVNVNEGGFLWLEPRNGGAGNTFLRVQGGAQQVTGWDSMRGTYSGWVGGDPIKGAFNLWHGEIGSQTVKGILQADK